jgi:hypothetical protein
VQEHLLEQATRVARRWGTKITGHKTDAVYDRYNIVTTEDTLAALESRRIFLEQRSKKSNVVKLRASNTDKKADS